MSNCQHIVIEDDGRLLAEAVVESHPGLVDAMLRVESGHIAPGTTARLVDAVLDLIRMPPGTALEMTFPTGQAEMLEQIRTRCPDMTTRVAGVSCRLHTTVPRPAPKEISTRLAPAATPRRAQPTEPSLARRHLGAVRA
jgi:hypothetical protein